MAKSPVSDHGNTSDHLKTWILKVYIHCEGCKKKVIKILQSIDGVYKTVIDAKEQKVTVIGSVNGESLVQKLLKSGKHAEILPGSFEDTPPKKKKPSNKQKDGTGNETEHVDEEKEKSKDAKTDGGNDVEVEAEPPAGASRDINNENNGGEKKKNKGGKDVNNTKPKEGDSTRVESEGTTEKTRPEKFNLGPPVNHMVYATPYDMIPLYNNNYYPNLAYGISYNTSYPSTESSYYTPPVYGYAESHPHPSVYYPPPPPPPPPYDRGSAFDDHDDEDDGRLCTIM